MLWFKNAIVYQLNKDNLFDTQAITNAVNACPFVPCGNTDSMRSGWVSPFGESQDNPLVLDNNGQMLLRLKKEIKILPSSVIKQALAEKVTQQEQLFNRKLKKAEKLSLKDEVYIDLLPRAFSKYQFFWLWIDTVNKRVIVDSSSFKQAEDILALLRKEMGTLALTPYASDTPLEKTLTKWVKESLSFPPIILGDEIELKDAVEDSIVVKCKNQEINSQEIFVHIDSGKQISKLKLLDERGMSFILNRDYTLKRIKFDNAILDKNEDFLPEESNAKLEADFMLMISQLTDTFKSMQKIIEEIITV
ncbi:recombination-associated protein RdgC [Frischella sp. Ac13]|uniref:Recombination-associated protein RdgC n=1 Tax=Frischella japonica TaxID=2741544 RepID=A0ABR7QZM4_9GAMM|nr:recombination-associated protein RdgC [Frischella japonica]MBC9131650.1 recombination-associated protein RdgC [Frischella japonica]